MLKPQNIAVKNTTGMITAIHSTTTRMQIPYAFRTTSWMGWYNKDGKTTNSRIRIPMKSWHTWLPINILNINVPVVSFATQFHAVIYAIHSVFVSGVSAMIFLFVPVWFVAILYFFGSTMRPAVGDMHSSNKKNWFLSQEKWCVVSDIVNDGARGFLQVKPENVSRLWR